MSTPRRKPEHAFGLGHGFAKALKKGVQKSIEKRNLQQRKAPSWWPNLEGRAA